VLRRASRVEGREPSHREVMRQIAALAPASSSLRATLRVGYPEHSHVPVLPKVAPKGRHCFAGAKCRQSKVEGRGLLRKATKAEGTAVEDSASAEPKGGHCLPGGKWRQSSSWVRAQKARGNAA